MTALTLLLATQLAGAPPEPAPLPALDPAAAGLLRGAASLAREGKAAEALAELERLAELAGDRLTPAAADPGWLVPVRRRCLEALAGLPTEVTAGHRQRQERKARFWLAEARRNRSIPPLLRILDEAPRAAVRAEADALLHNLLTGPPSPPPARLPGWWAQGPRRLRLEEVVPVRGGREPPVRQDQAIAVGPWTYALVDTGAGVDLVAWGAGRPQWRCPLTGATPAAAPALVATPWGVLAAPSPGVVVAVDPDRGQVRWARVLPDGGLGLHAAGDRLFVAADGTGQLRCLDAVDGRLVWATQEIAVRQILGVHAGRLILATAGDLRALDAATGVLAWRHYWDEPPAAGAAGLLAEGQILWPAPAGLEVREPGRGRVTAVWPGVPEGALALDGGRLLIRVADRRAALVPEEAAP